MKTGKTNANRTSLKSGTLCGVRASNTDPDVEPDSEDSERNETLEDKVSGLKYATCLQPVVCSTVR